MRKKIMLAALAASSMLALGAMSPGFADPVTLTYWSGFTGGDKQAFLDLIKKFNDTHPDIQVDYQLQPWDSIAQKLPTAIISGSGPDLGDARLQRRDRAALRRQQTRAAARRLDRRRSQSGA